MVMYATPTELAGRLQRDLDTYTATQALTLASAEFSTEADTWFAPTTTTWSTVASGATEVRLPFSKVTAVSAVRVGGVTVTGSTLVAGVLYRAAGFGSYGTYPPVALEVDLTHGYSAVPDDVKRAVLDMAAADYDNPTRVVSERVDDYQVTYFTGSAIPPSGRPWREVAAGYRGIAVA